jgi:hypothetical protein
VYSTLVNAPAVPIASALWMNLVVRASLAFATPPSAQDALALAEKLLTDNALVAATASRTLATATAAEAVWTLVAAHAPAAEYPVTTHTSWRHLTELLALVAPATLTEITLLLIGSALAAVHHWTFAADPSALRLQLWTTAHLAL